jgi:hypothetical protein
MEAFKVLPRSGTAYRIYWRGAWVATMGSPLHFSWNLFTNGRVIRHRVPPSFR